jgi:hypothetical protein
MLLIPPLEDVRHSPCDASAVDVRQVVHDGVGDQILFRDAETSALPLHRVPREPVERDR